MPEDEPSSESILTFLAWLMWRQCTMALEHCQGSGLLEFPYSDYTF
jgi:hypothetical protein